MILPDRHEWLHSAKALLAALLALYIALALPLDNPYWAMASVYVVSHPLSGATRSKALYRVLGTLLGAAACVLMLPPLAHQPLVLSLACGLWVALLLFMSLLDHTPRSYIFMLAGYTVPLVMLPEVEHPMNIFHSALARSEEIILGISCAAIINSVLFPARIAPVASRRCRQLLDETLDWISQRLSDESAASAALPGRLLADVMSLDGMIVQLGYDGHGSPSLRAMRELRSRLTLLLPATQALAHSLQQLRSRHGALPDELQDLLAHYRQLDTDNRQALDSLLQRCHHAEGFSEDLLTACALRQLERVLQLQLDCSRLLDSLASDAALPPLHQRALHLGEHSRHRDYPTLLWNAASVGTSVTVACLLWIASGWEYGFPAVFMAAVSGSFFAGLDNPKPLLRMMLRWTLITVAVAGIYQFGLLPRVSDFWSLALMLALPLLAFGTLTGRPQFAIIALLFPVQTISIMNLQDNWHGNFALFADMALATVLGLAFSLTWASITRSFSGLRRVERLQRGNWQTLAELAGPQPADPGDLAGQCLERSAVLMQQGFGRETIASRQLATAFALLVVQQHHQPQVDALLPVLQAHCWREQQGDSDPAADQQLQQQMQQLINQLDWQHDNGARDLAIALTSLQQTLHPVLTAHVAPTSEALPA